MYLIGWVAVQCHWILDESVLCLGESEAVILDGCTQSMKNVLYYHIPCTHDHGFMSCLFIDLAIQYHWILDSLP